MSLLHGSLFAGIGGFDLGFERAGIKTLWMVETDKHCQKVLRTRFPDAKLYGDVTELNPSELDRVDIISAGFPCQDLSVAGKRKGLKGERSGLFFEIVGFLEELRPAWAVLENVPGLLSSNRGRDFAVVLGSLAECGYGVSWRILDSQFFGVPQRRRRVFIVGCLGKPCPPEILFESESSQRNTQKGRKAGKDITSTVRKCFAKHGAGGKSDNLIAGTLRSGRRIPDSGGNPAQGIVVAGFSGGQSAKARSLGYREEQSPTIKGTESGTNQVPNVCQTSNPNGMREASGIPRRVDLPVLGFRNLEVKDGQTGTLVGQGDNSRKAGINDLPMVLSQRGENACKCPDSPRYRALGNAVTVNVVERIGRKIMAQEMLL